MLYLTSAISSCKFTTESLNTYSLILDKSVIVTATLEFSKIILLFAVAVISPRVYSALSANDANLPKVAVALSLVNSIRIQNL